MLGFLKREAGEVYKKAKRKGLAHYEKSHRTRAYWYFKRAARACPQRIPELAKFYYDNHDYKRACQFYDWRLSDGGASKNVYRYAAKAYEKRAETYAARKAFDEQNQCRAQAMTYRTAIAQRFAKPPPLPIAVAGAPAI